MANSIYVDTSFDIKQRFVDDSKTYFNSSMIKLSFKSDPEEQRQYINDWVLSKTNLKINEVYPKGQGNIKKKILSDFAERISIPPKLPFLPVRTYTLRRLSTMPKFVTY